MQKLEPLVDKLYLIEQELDGSKVRGAVLPGTTKVLIWDSLIFPKGLANLQDLCAERDIIVVYSHADWDHVWGTCGLAYQEVIAHEHCAKRFSDSEDVAKYLRNFQAKYPDELKGISLVPPTRTFSTQLSLELGGLSVELSYLPGHSLDGIVAFIPELGVLLGGDAFETPLPLLYENSPLNVWIEALETWASDERLKLAIPGHGSLGAKDLLDYNLAYLKALKANERFDIPYLLDDFYQEAHTKNQHYAKKLH